MLKLLSIFVAAAAISSLATAQTVRSFSAIHGHAPNFTRVDLNHKKIELSDLRGKVVLLNFWASWCGPCLTEMPTFAQWQNQYGAKGLQVIGVSMDDSVQDAASIVAKLKLDYPVVMGDAKLGELYGGILGLPATFLIDRNGIIRFKHQGATDPNVSDREIQMLLREH